MSNLPPETEEPQPIEPEPTLSPATATMLTSLALGVGAFVVLWFGMVFLQERPPEFPYANIRGFVTVSGMPITDGRITFAPESNYATASQIPLDADGRPKKFSCLLKDGNYSCRFLPVGRSYVTFESFVEGEDVLPAELGLGMMADIAEGEQTMDFELANQ
jgi:hypothetical protein